MKFVVRFLNLSTKQTEYHILETRTVGQALKRALALTMGKDTQDLFIAQQGDGE